MFTCKSRNFQKRFENELFFLQYYHKVRYLANKKIILSKKINQEMNFLILLTDKAPQMYLNCNSILQDFKDAGANATNRVFIS